MSRVEVDVGEDGYQRIRARLDVFDESIYLTRYDEGRAVSCYEVAPEGLSQAFSGVPVSTGLMPKRTLFYSLSGGEARIGVYLPGGVRELAIAGEAGRIRVPLPPLVFVGQGMRYAVYAVKQRPSEASERLFHAPLPNVISDGRICHGNVVFPTCSRGTVYAAVEAFLGSEFNGHLAGGKSIEAPENVLEWWRRLAREEQARYPLGDLIRSGLKLGDVMGGR